MIILLLIFGIIAAVFLVKVGRTRFLNPGMPEDISSWAAFLSIGFSLLIGTALLITLIFGDSGSLYVMVLLPLMCALFAESCLCFLTVLRRLIFRQAEPFLRWPAWLLLLIPLMLTALGLLADTFFFQIVFYAGILLASGWLVWSKIGRWLALSYTALLLFSVFAVWAIDTRDELLFLPTNLVAIVHMLIALAPGLGIIFASRLLGWVLVDEHGFRFRRLLVACVLVIPVFLLMAWHAATASAWDVATDGLGGIFMLQLVFIFGIACAAHESWRLPVKRNSYVFGLVFLVLVITVAANSFGTFGFDGDWGNVPHARTARRVEMINQAIQRYYSQEGQYPRELVELTPRYLVILPTPFIIPRQGWCYQAGRDYYRLGYVYRDYFSTPASVKIHAAAGALPDLSWPCDGEAAKYRGF